jgi:TonB family protein
MSFPKPKRRRQSPHLLVALILAALLHQVVLTCIGYFFGLSDEAHETKAREITLVTVALPEPEQEGNPLGGKEPLGSRESKQKLSGARISAVRPPRLAKPQPAQTGGGSLEQSEAQHAAAEATPGTAEPMAERRRELRILPDWSSFEKTFGDTAKQERLDYSEKSIRQRGTPFGFGSLYGKVKDAIGSKRGWVKPGNQEPLGARQKLFRDYIWVVHEKIHPYFADSFLASLSVFSPNDPINNFNLYATAEFEILENGRVNEVRIIRSSGNNMFDAAAADSIYRSSPHPPPPEKILSWNRRLYLRWGFYRNQRKCGEFNAEPYILRAPDAQEEPIKKDDLIIDG